MYDEKIKYLKCLSRQYPDIDSAATEIINLQSILNLPKGTEHFLSDIHGEYEAFSHILRNGSGAVMKKINDVYGSGLSEEDKRELASLIYYPSEKLEYMKSAGGIDYEQYRKLLYELVEVCKIVSSKYTRSKVRKALPDNFRYVIEELITEKKEVLNKAAYYDEIISAVIKTGVADKFIVSMSELIQRLVIDRLHIIGDIYDRGSGPHLVMDRLLEYHSLDIQWGNHDVLWMGAYAGQEACIANAVRTSLLYDNISVLENGYGISMTPLALFAVEEYADDPCLSFAIRGRNSKTAEALTEMKMHKAIAVIQFKLEGRLIAEHPEYNMDDRRLLGKIDFENGTVEIQGRRFELNDGFFPTINPEDPYELSREERIVVKKLKNSFTGCAKLGKHIRLLLQKGNLYKICNGNLLFHGCIPINEDGSFRAVNLFGTNSRGKELYDEIELCVRKAFLSRDDFEKKQGRDILWYLWNGADSPLYGRNKMATFERYFINDKSTHTETKDIYYSLIDKEETALKIFENFGIDYPNAHIINGHVPVHHFEGESPVKCGGKVIIIDGGFSKSYHKVTGIAGYTLIYNSYGLSLTAHEPFDSVDDVVRNGTDMKTRKVASQKPGGRILVGDTDSGRKIRESIAELEELISAYRDSVIGQNDS